MDLNNVMYGKKIKLQTMEHLGSFNSIMYIHKIFVVYFYGSSFSYQNIITFIHIEMNVFHNILPLLKIGCAL